MIEIFRKQCTGCRACEKMCKKNAIEMVADEKGFLYPKVNYKKCIECGLCKLRCPINNEEKENDIKAYAAFNKNQEIRENSSSGGVFTVFAEYFLDKGGVVFGVGFDEEFKAENVKVENKGDLKKLRGAKYLQSNTKDTYLEAKKLLEEGKKVYYSGTPCQIEGLYSYLGKQYENLITQDLICHGVPSPKVWEEYLKYKGKKIKDIRFRSKEKCTWENYELSFTYEDGKESINHNKDVYMNLFLKDVILRDSCYNCKFKKENRMSDITLADFWGIDEVEKGFNDKRGTSLLILNSAKAKDLVEKLRDKIELKEVDLKKAIKHNKSMVSSVKKHEKSNEVFKMLEDGKIFEIFKSIEEGGVI